MICGDSRYFHYHTHRMRSSDTELTTIQSLESRFRVDKICLYRLLLKFIWLWLMKHFFIEITDNLVTIHLSLKISFNQ